MEEYRVVNRHGAEYGREYYDLEGAKSGVKYWESFPECRYIKPFRVEVREIGPWRPVKEVK